jgi:hypothetical protein
MYYDIKCGVLKIALLSNSLFGASAAPRKPQAHAGEEVNGMPSMSNRRLLVLVLTLLVGAGGQSLAGTDTQLTLTGVWENDCTKPLGLHNAAAIFAKMPNAGPFILTAIMGGDRGLSASTYPVVIRSSIVDGKAMVDYLHGVGEVNRVVMHLSRDDVFLVERVVNSSGRLTTDNGVMLSSGERRAPYQRCSKLEVRAMTP